MSVRLRSWLGAFLILAGVLSIIVAGNYAETVSFLVWPGIGSIVLGLIVVLFAFRAVLRQIGSSQARFEAMLKSEVQTQRQQNPGDGK